ncbi:hypothetical protein, conserved [Eimeria necatrix]|uniref:Uncharacterized protein n=1 Tax=Eimeria necatrix TaxID=51315 RepID=U6MVJ5_9EIME|nr:hypothetical protein, conserved [Eimeria necatrix]CDJ66504.1 hypothetical protein, conserved [Eimeria necatrix]
MAHETASAVRGPTQGTDVTKEATEASLNGFLGNPRWWPEETECLSFSDSSDGLRKVHRKCAVRQVSRERVQALRDFLARAFFETVTTRESKEGIAGNGKEGPQLPQSADDTRLRWLRDVPPCFAPFTRFNCNVTLVGQRLFGSQMGVSVLCSGTVTVEGSDTAHLLTHTKAGELVYARHVMLTTTNCLSDKPAHQCQPFSYGFLVVNLSCLPPMIRDLVLSETLPFGGILDRCAVSRSVETDRQLHIHLDSHFFGSDDNVAQFRLECEETPLESSGPYVQQPLLKCQCNTLPPGTVCTFGRLTTVWTYGQAAARVVEILNERVVLPALFRAEAEQERHSGHAELSSQCPENADGVMDAFQSRRAFLAGRCLQSVAHCPLHFRVLPKPHVTKSDLMHLKRGDEGCCLCGSKSCSTEFHAAFTEDLR